MTMQIEDQDQRSRCIVRANEITSVRLRSKRFQYLREKSCQLSRRTRAETLATQSTQVCTNKQSESYSCLLSDSLEVRGKGKANRRDNKAAKNRKRKERRKIKDKKRFFNAIGSCKQYIKNLSNEQLKDKQITLLQLGLKFIPTPVTKENLIRRQLLADFNQFARRMRLQYIFHGEENEPHPFHVKSDWEPLVQLSVALETFLEEVNQSSQVLNLTSQKLIYRRESAKLSKSYRATVVEERCFTPFLCGFN